MGLKNSENVNVKTDLGQIITGGPGWPAADVAENSAHREEGLLGRPQLQEGGAGTALRVKFVTDSDDAGDAGDKR